MTHYLWIKTSKSSYSRSPLGNRFPIYSTKENKFALKTVKNMSKFKKKKHEDLLSKASRFTGLHWPEFNN